MIDYFSHLREAAERDKSCFKQIFHGLPDAAILIDPHDYPDVSWPIVDCNEAACNMNGYERAELLSTRHSIDVLHPGGIPPKKYDRQKYLEMLRELAQDRKHLEVEIVHQSKTGAPISIHCFTSLVFIDGLEMVVGIDRDITSLKTAQSTARGLEQSLRTISHFMVLGSYDGTLNAIAAGIQDTLNCDAVTLYAYDIDTGTVHSHPTVVGVNYPDGVRSMGEIAPDSLVNKIINSDLPCIVNDVGSDELFSNSRFTKDEGIKSLAVFPLAVANNKVGLAFINFRTFHSFTDSETQNLQVFLELAAIAMHNAHNFNKAQWELEERRRAQMRASALQRTIESISRVTALGDFDETMGAITEGMREVLGCEVVVLYPYDMSIGRLWVHPSFVGVNCPDKVRDCVSIPRDSIVYQMLEENEPYVVNDVEQNALYCGRRFTQDEEIKSVVAIPLHAKGNKAGVMFVNYRSLHEFTPEEIADIELFANQAAIAIYNLQLLDQEREQRKITNNILDIVGDVADSMSRELEYEDLLQTIVSQLLSLLQCSQCTLFIKESVDGRDLLVPKVTDGKTRDTSQIRTFGSNEGLAGYVLSTGAALLVPHVEQNEDYEPGRTGETTRQSMILAPIKIGDQSIGVISADMDADTVRPSGFMEMNRRLLDALAKQIGVAINRAYSIKLLLEIGHNIIMSPSEVGHTLKEIVSGANRLSNTDTGVIWLFKEDGVTIDEERSTPYPQSEFHPHPRATSDSPDKLTLTQTVVRTKSILEISDLSQDDRVSQELRACGYKSLIAVPLILKTKVIGVLYLHDKNFHKFSETEKSLLNILSRQAVVAIQNADLLKHEKWLREKAETLVDISAHLSTAQSPEKIRDAILDSVAKLVSHHGVTIQSIEGNSRTLLGDRGIAKRNTDVLLRNISKDRLVEELVQNREICIIPNTSACNLWEQYDETEHVRSWIGIPLVYQGYIIGLITLDHTEAGFYQRTPELEHTLRLFARLAANALENAHLMEDRTDLAYLGIMVSSIKHTICNHMNAVSYELQNVRNELQQLSALGDHDTSLTRLQRRIEETLKTAQYVKNEIEQTKGSRKPVYIGDLLERFLLTFSSSTECQVQKDIQIDDQVQVYINPDLLKEALCILLRNGEKEVQAQPSDQILRVTASQSNDGNWAIINIQDTGGGIPPDIAPLVFKRRIRQQKSGMGLGMLIAGVIIDGLGGTTRIVDTHLPGTTIEVKLPTI